MIFEYSLDNIITNTYCNNKKLCNDENCKKCFEKSFASHEKSIYWSKKNNIKPRYVFKSSGKKYLFNCNCGHEFENTICNISLLGRWCSYCSNPSQKLCNDKNCKKCFEKSFASHEKSIYWSEKNNIKPRQVFKFSHKKYLFNCACGHEFEGILSNISNGVWCPYCCNPSQKLCNDENCKKCFEKSFASHEKSIYWSQKNNIEPRQVLKCSDNKYLFNCVCGHEFENHLYALCNNCSYCSNPPKQLCNDENCKKCFEKSFSSHEKSIYWSKKNNIKPRYAFKYSNKKYLFNCDCGHEFEISLSNISYKNQWCSYCCIPSRKLCDHNKCKNCFERSFASHFRSEYFYENNKINPRNLFKLSNKKYLFKCEYNHSFKTELSNIVLGNQWCPLCKNKTEDKILKILKNDYLDIKYQYKKNWCKNEITNNYLPFDFVLENKKIIIELDGLQHFEQVSNWKSPEEQNIRDIYKMKCANNNGYSIIRITQNDVYKDTFDWYKMLKESIESISKKNTVENHYISYEEDYYIKFIILLNS
jgi:very-short-patch-repair endonuclease